MGTITSDFSGGSGQWGTNASGFTWLTFAANSLSTNGVVSTQNSIFYTAVSFGDDQSSEVTIGSGWVGSAGPGVTVRSRTNGTRYRFLWFAGTWYLQYGIATGTGNLTGTPGSAGGPVGLSSGDKLKIIVVGHVINCYYNGLLVIGPVTDANITSGGAPGIEFGTGSPNAAIDTFWTGTGTVTPPPPGLTRAQVGDPFFGF